jgi:hypothetical protein
VNENAYVVVFPSVFSENKIPRLISNIEAILKLKDQRYHKLFRDDSVIVIDANDPVFASSAINILFGIKRVAIAKQVKNEFNTITSEIAKIGSNLLLRGERFLVKVEGYSSGFLTKDVELSSTSLLIEKASKLGAKPGTEQKYDKLIYAYLTKAHAYICIFIDEGKGGVPNFSQNRQIVCGVFDEISVVSCLETIKQGFDVKILVFYTKRSELLHVVKMLDNILQQSLRAKVDLEFFKLPKVSKNFLHTVEAIIEVMCRVAIAEKIGRISISVSVMIHPVEFIESIFNRTQKHGLIPYLPLSGLDNDIFETTSKVGLDKYLNKIGKLVKIRFGKSDPSTIKNAVEAALKTRKEVSIRVGSNTVHDILYKFEQKH